MALACKLVFCQSLARPDVSCLCLLSTCRRVARVFWIDRRVCLRPYSPLVPLRGGIRGGEVGHRRQSPSSVSSGLRPSTPPAKSTNHTGRNGSSPCFGSNAARLNKARLPKTLRRSAARSSSQRSSLFPSRIALCLFFSALHNIFHRQPEPLGSLASCDSHHGGAVLLLESLPGRVSRTTLFGPNSTLGFFEFSTTPYVMQTTAAALMFPLRRSQLRTSRRRRQVLSRGS